MSTLAETVELSISELDRLTALGVISEDLRDHLLSVVNNSRTGRLFGHDSAVLYPRKILEMTQACSSLLDKDDKNFNRIRVTVAKKFAARNRKPTDLIRVISEVVDDISHKPRLGNPRSSVVVKEKRGWFASLFGK